MPNPEISEYLQFYADTPIQKNKFFSWKINSIVDLESRLHYWSNRFYIRSAFYVCKEGTTIIQNDKIDLVTFIDARDIQFIRE